MNPNLNWALVYLIGPDILEDYLVIGLSYRNWINRQDPHPQLEAVSISLEIRSLNSIFEVVY
jgi:hypothetical protein